AVLTAAQGHPEALRRLVEQTREAMGRRRGHRYRPIAPSDARHDAQIARRLRQAQPDGMTLEQASEMAAWHSCRQLPPVALPSARLPARPTKAKWARYTHALEAIVAGHAEKVLTELRGRGRRSTK